MNVDKAQKSGDTSECNDDIASCCSVNDDQSSCDLYSVVVPFSFKSNSVNGDFSQGTLLHLGNFPNLDTCFYSNGWYRSQYYVLSKHYDIPPFHHILHFYSGRFCDKVIVGCDVNGKDFIFRKLMTYSGYQKYKLTMKLDPSYFRTRFRVYFHSFKQNGVQFCRGSNALFVPYGSPLCWKDHGNVSDFPNSRYMSSLDAKNFLVEIVYAFDLAPVGMGSPPTVEFPY
jgi:hypothetical protein